MVVVVFICRRLVRWAGCVLPFKRSEVTSLSLWFKCEHFQERSGVSPVAGKDFVLYGGHAKGCAN